MSKFRKKPVVIEAFQVGSSRFYPEWLHEAVSAGVVVTHAREGSDGWKEPFDHADIQTLEGVMRADRGDWIIRGVEGDLYPCKDSIFRKTYEPAGDGEPPAQQINQCDGCRRGLPVNERGIHRGEGYDLIACTAHLYQAPAQEPMAVAELEDQSSYWHRWYLKTHEELEAVRQGWIRVIDEFLVTRHLGIASPTDTYDEARAKLLKIIDFEIAIATDSVMGGDRVRKGDSK